ncbi:MAG: biotin/lipoyl-binding protein, partial [Cyanobacteria bacterium]|nr:biotin/lipoyl-binding protein [Cyanobacteriota bacterium]
MKPELTLKSVLRSAELAQRDIDPLESLGVGSQPEDDNAVSHESCAPSIMLQTTSDSNHSNADRHTHTSDKKSAVYAQGSADNSYSPLSGSLLIEKSEPNLRQSPKRKRVILSVAAIVLIVAIGIASYLQFNKKPAASAAKSPPPVVTVCTEAAKIQMMEDVLNVTGSVSAWDPLNVGAEVSGLRIKSVSVEEGDFVKKGQPLAVLNSA